jgi:ATP-binding cassette, subfamily F, member 3
MLASTPFAARRRTPAHRQRFGANPDRGTRRRARAQRHRQDHAVPRHRRRDCARAGQLDAALARPALYDDPARATGLAKARAEAAEALAEAETEWLAATTEYEAASTVDS